MECWIHAHRDDKFLGKKKKKKKGLMLNRIKGMVL